MRYVAFCALVLVLLSTNACSAVKKLTASDPELFSSVAGVGCATLSPQVKDAQTKKLVCDAANACVSAVCK